MKILSFGSLNYDYTYEVEHFLAPKETLAAKSMQRGFGGKGANQSIAFARAGLSVYHAAPYDVGILTYPMELVDVLCVNEVEACALAGTETFEADAVLTLLHEKYPQTRLLLTAGSAGSYYLDAERRLFVPCEKVQAVDTTAAGDTYSGYFLAGLCSGSSVEDAMRLATKAAGIAVQRKGAAASIPEIKELK